MDVVSGRGGSGAYPGPVMAQGAGSDDYEVPEAEVARTPKMGPAEKLLKFINTPNIAADLGKNDKGKQTLAEMSSRVVADYDIDKASRSDWELRTKAAMDLAMMVAEAKDYPWPGASNVKYPLVAKAALQFNAQASPALLVGDRVAKVKTFGADNDGAKAARGERVAQHLSWQLTEEIPEWLDDTDRLLVILPITGCVFRKTYFDPALGRKCSRLVTADRFVINYRARSLEDAPRFTEQLMLYPQEIAERILDGRFVEFDYGTASSQPDEPGKEAEQSTEDDEDAPHLFLEQHRYWDLDGDGYKEPYIVTVHKDTQQVCRVVANYTAESVRLGVKGNPKSITLTEMQALIDKATEGGATVTGMNEMRVSSIKPQTFFTRYLFLPSPDGGFYGMGFGTLLKDTAESINSTMNQMLDAGHLSNVQGGFISSSLSQREKSIKIKMGEWKVINTGGGDLRAGLVPITYPGPSEVLFKLLGLLIEQGNDLASIKDVLTGETGGKVMQPTTVLAMIEQGMKVFNAIFKRVHRAIKAELLIHARLNVQNLTPEAYNEFFDDQAQQFDPKADYEASDKGISPVSDPTVATKTTALAQAALIRETALNNPFVNQEEATRRVFQAGEIPDIDKLMAPPPQPDPKEVAFMEAMKKLSLQELVAKIGRLNTQQLKDIADAEAAEEGQQLAGYEAFVRMLQAEHGMEMDNAQPGGAGGMAGVLGASSDGAPPAGGPAPGGGAAPVGPQGSAPVPDAEPVGGMGVPAA